MTWHSPQLPLPSASLFFLTEGMPKYIVTFCLQGVADRCSIDRMESSGSQRTVVVVS